MKEVAGDAALQARVAEVLSGEGGTEIWSLVMLSQQLDDVIAQCRNSAEPANLAKYTFSLARRLAVSITIIESLPSRMRCEERC